MELHLTILYSVCATVIFLMGIFVIWGKYKLKSNLYFFFYTISVLIWMFSLYFGYFFVDKGSLDLALVFIRLAYAFSLMGMLLMTSFFYYFPSESIKYPKWLRLSFGAVVICLAFISVLGGAVHADFIIEDSVYVGDKLGDFYTLYMLGILATFILSLGFAFKKALNSSGIEKNKSVFAMFGCLGFVFLAIMTNVVLPIFDIFVFQREAAIFTLAFIVPAYYAIEKYRFFHFSYLSYQFFRKLILLMIYVLTVFLIHRFICLFMPSLHHDIQILLSAVISIILVFRFELYLPRFTTREHKLLKNLITDIKTRMYQFEKYEDLQDFLELKFVLELNVNSVKLLSVRKKKLDLKIPVYIEDEFTKRLKETEEKILIYEELKFRGFSEEVLELYSSAMRSLSAAVVIPLKVGENIIGLFVLGKKGENEFFTREEILEISELRTSLEVVLMNVLLKQNLREENDIMKEVIEEKTKELKKQFSEIKNLLRQQSDFLAVTAHELRTPLSIALFQIEDTLDNYESNSDVLDDLKTIEGSLVNLKNLTQKLFDVQQYDLKKVQLNKSAVNFGIFLEEMVEGFKGMIETRIQDLFFMNKLNDDLVLEIDIDRMRQVVYNLLDNAVKHGNKVYIVLDEDSQYLYVRVVDNGDGVLDLDKVRIFEKFQTTKVSMVLGVGLGLYVCKKIMELHEGEIWVEDNEAGGASFILKLKKELG